MVGGANSLVEGGASWAVVGVARVGAEREGEVGLITLGLMGGTDEADGEGGTELLFSPSSFSSVSNKRERLL